MRQINIANAYMTTEELSKGNDLTIAGKWALYKLRKELSSYFEFYMGESQKLFANYETISEGNLVHFKSHELAVEYKTKQDEIDNLDVEVNIEKQKCKLSDIPSIKVQDMEILDKFIEFLPE